MSHERELYIVQNTVNNYVISLVTRLIIVIICEMYRNSKWLCYVPGANTVVGQLYFKNKLTNR